MAKCDCCGEQIVEWRTTERNLVGTCDEESSVPKIGVFNEGEANLFADVMYPKIVSVSAHASNKKAERFKRRLMKQLSNVRHFEVKPYMLKEVGGLKKALGKRKR